MSDLTGTAAQHRCPGLCGALVSRHQFACRTCWSRLPMLLQTAITSTFEARKHATGIQARAARNLHAGAMGDAMRWYRDHPR